MGEQSLIARQLGREPRAFRRVAVRCPHGGPAVLEQEPFDRDGSPFPTQFWLSCAHLNRLLARLEAAGGVERWTRAAAQDSALAASLAAGNAEQRSLRPELPGGIGGAGSNGSLKCLHAHAAFALARPGYLLGEGILAEVAPLWPDVCCAQP